MVTGRLAIAASVFLVCLFLSVSAAELPKFSVAGEHGRAYAILVSPSTSQAQLEALLKEFQKARHQRKVQYMIPRWSDRGTDPPLEVLVFTEPIWATSDKLEKFMNMSMKSSSSRAFSKEYVKHIRAHYFYSVAEEELSIGYDDGMDRSPDFRKISYRKK